MDSERSIDDTLQYLHSDFFRLNTRADGTKRHRGNRVENLVKEANEGDVVEDLNAGGTMTLDEEGNTTALLLPSAFSGLNSYREAPSPAKVKEVKEHSKIVYNPNMIKPVKTISLPAESEQPGTPGLSRRASKFRNAGHQVIKGRTSFRSVVLALSNSQDPLKLAQKSTGLDLLRSAQKSTGWGSKSQKSTKMKDAMKEEKDVKGNEKAKEALKEETVTKVVSSSMKDDKGMSGRQGKQSEEDKTQVDDQQEKLSGEMGVFPNWLWERDDFQTIHNQPLTDTCLRILSNVPDERHELHLSKLKQWVAKKENGACIPFLSELPAQLLTGVLKVLKLQRISEGEVLHREGQTGEIFYMLFSGTMAATTKGPLGRMRSMKAGETFGHSSLSSSYQETIKHNRRSKSKKGGHELEADDRQQHRHETVQATTDCVLLTLGYYAYDSMQREHQKQQEKDELDFLKGLPTFAGWDKTRIHHLHSAMQPKVVDKGELLWRQGMPADSIALVLEGQLPNANTDNTH
jgi:CRP-like cAMP-binding protein